MADSIRTPLEQQVDEIEAIINAADVRSGANVYCGSLGSHKYDGPRRVIFVPSGGTVEAPVARGRLEVETLKHGRPLAAVPINVTAHIVAETHAHCWVLWQNVINASRQSLKKGSLPGEFIWNPAAGGADSHLPKVCEYVVQQFTWNLHLFEGQVPMPAYGRPVTGVTNLGDMVPLEIWTNEVDILDPDEPDP